VAFEQLLYLRQPGYGTSYIVGKLQFERLMAEYAHRQAAAGKPFSVGEFFARMNSCGTIPFALIESEMTGVDTPGVDTLGTAAPGTDVPPGVRLER
jgi:uncharacterized protein (DUF885 family)